MRKLKQVLVDVKKLRKTFSKLPSCGSWFFFVVVFFFLGSKALAFLSHAASESVL